jgi:hypothetical protein
MSTIPTPALQATSLATMLGMQRVDKRGFSVSWALPVIDALHSAGLSPAGITVPGMIGNGLGGMNFWGVYIFDPNTVSGAFQFGTAKSFHIEITRVKTQIESATNMYVPGRVVVYDPVNNKAWTYGPRDVSPIVITTVDHITGELTAPAIFECENGDGDINIHPGSQIQIWVELDISSDGTTLKAISSLTTMIITLFNFER